MVMWNCSYCLPTFCSKSSPVDAAAKSSLTFFCFFVFHLLFPTVMKLPSTCLAFVIAAFGVNASSSHDSRALFSRHLNMHSRSPTVVAKSVKKRACKARSSKAATTTKAPTTTSIHKALHTDVESQPSPPKPTNVLSGVINIKSNCGPTGATEQTTPTTGPNGSIDWLNCGLTNGGWNPPYVHISDIISVSLSTAVESGNGPFLACSNYVHLFEQYGNQYNIPGILLAAFAMQESSCNPNAVGRAGEQGLMQITDDKCGGAPNNNCQDPDFNIRTGAKFFADTLDGNGGDLLLSIGRYNGWSRGLTLAEATAAAKTSCCFCQNNCDYLHQFLNGWLQNIDARNSSLPLGKYFNLDVCDI